MAASGIILAGGKNSRMGANKALLTIGNSTFIQGTVHSLRQFCTEVIVVTNEPDRYQGLGVKVTEDIIPNKGPLSGVHAGLTVSANFHNFVVACDMPFLDWTLGKYMVDKINGLDVLIPRSGEYLQPLHAVYSKNCIRPIEKCLKQEKCITQDILKVIAFYPEVKVGYLDEEDIRGLANLEQVFFNVNTPEDLKKARAIKKDAEGMG